MTMNPADEAADSYKNEMDKLRAEVNRSRMNVFFGGNPNQMVFFLD